MPGQTNPIATLCELIGLGSQVQCSGEGLLSALSVNIRHPSESPVSLLDSKRVVGVENSTELQLPPSSVCTWPHFMWRQGTDPIGGKVL